MQFLKKLLAFVMDILETITFVGSIFIAVYLFIMQPNQVKGASMDPTFSTGDYIFTSKITYKFRRIERGDIVVFKSPKNPDIEFIKRIIAVPGDIIHIEGGRVYLNGALLNEPYILSRTNLFDGGYLKEGREAVIPEGFIFVMGDNRSRSSDSREFGPIPISTIIGHVFYRYFPAQKMGIIENPIPKDLRTLEDFNQVVDGAIQKAL